jgi:hypothetical protein
MPTTKTTRRVNLREPCPVCEKATWCRVAINGSYAVCNRTESHRPARGHGGGWIHHLDGRDNGTIRTERPNYRTEDAVPSASPDWIAHVYLGLLGHTHLEGQHRQALLARGFTDRQIDKRRYRTLAGGRAGLCRAIHEGEFELLRGVPGFYQKQGDDGRPYWSIAGAGGLLIPCLDPGGEHPRPARSAGQSGRRRQVPLALFAGQAGRGRQRRSLPRRQAGRRAVE